MLGTGLDPRYVVTFLEFMLAVYSVALFFTRVRWVVKFLQ